MSIFKWQRIQFHQILIKTYNKYIQENEWPHTICGLGFESQAHHLRFNLFTFKLCDVKRTKINKKEAGTGPYFNIFRKIGQNTSHRDKSKDSL